MLEQQEQATSDAMSVGDADGEENFDEEGEEDLDEEGEEGEEEDDDEDEEEEEAESGRKGKGGGGNSKKAAAALAVQVGSFCDPEESLGIAHFLEHMVFMGSEAFPTENEYDKYLTQNGGSCNAYTEMEFTLYHFDVMPSAFRGALERFASQFVAPLCLASTIDREVQAVDSEFFQCLQSDPARLQAMQGHSAVAGHPFGKFSWGNKKSLVDAAANANADLRTLVYRFYEEHYCAERMSLVVLGAEPLDELESWVSELFANVRTGGGSPPRFDSAGPPFLKGDSETLPLYRVRSVREKNQLTISYTISCFEKHYRTKPEEQVSHLFGHEGAGSILSALKSQGLATDLWAGVSDGGMERNSAAWIFGIGITLTDAGLADVQRVIGFVFGYAELLREAGPQRWVFDELRAMNEIDFRFQEEEDAVDYVERLSAKLHLFAPEHSLAGEYLMDEWEPNLVEQVLSELVPANARVDLMTPSYDVDAAVAAGAGGANVVERFHEPWFDFDYVLERLPIPACERAGLALPPRNSYIPTDFSLRSSKKEEAAAGEAAAAAGEAEGSAETETLPPGIVLETPTLRVWHKLDKRFLQPRTNAYFQFCCPVACESAKSTASAELVMRLVEDALKEDSYLADQGGLSLDFHRDGCRFDIRVTGFSEKLPLFAEKVFHTFSSLRVIPDRLELVREALDMRYRNIAVRAKSLASIGRLVILQRHCFHADAVLAEIRSLTLEEVQSFHTRMLSSLHVEVLSCGNLTSEEATAIARCSLEQIATPPAAIPETVLPSLEQVSQLPLGESVVALRGRNPEETNSVVELYLQLEVSDYKGDLRNNAMVDLLDQIVYEPYFDTLRTKEQLGYTVYSSRRQTNGVLGFCGVVQSSNYGPDHIEARIESFLEGFLTTLESMDEEEFERNRSAAIELKLQKDRALADEVDRHWDAIWSRHYDFTARKREAEAMRRISRTELAEWYAHAIHPRGAARRKLAVKVYSAKAEEEAREGDGAPVSFASLDAVVSMRDSLEALPSNFIWQPQPRH
mmetsp:Transcript_29851/g.97207  ORF Transcript_29851/g.97207 Transcript_29851/m.97207 type:complete len:1027 (-) Transcript_29851:78-3158(-)